MRQYRNPDWKLALLGVGFVGAGGEPLAVGDPLILFPPPAAGFRPNSKSEKYSENPLPPGHWVGNALEGERGGEDGGGGRGKDWSSCTEILRRSARSVSGYLGNEF